MHYANRRNVLCFVLLVVASIAMITFGLMTAFGLKPSLTAANGLEITCPECDPAKLTSTEAACPECDPAKLTSTEAACPECNPYDLTANASSLDYPCKKIVKKPVTYICLYPASEDRFISVHFHNNRSWESNMVKEATSWLAEHPDYGFIDIGANIGAYTMPIAAMGHDVVAVDAVYVHGARIHKAASLSGTVDRITMLVNAISNERGLTNIIPNPDHNPGGTNVKVAKLEPGERFNDTNNARAIVMNDLLPFCKFKKAIVKIDIEGFEHRAFNQAEKLFDNIDIAFIKMEWSKVKENEKLGTRSTDNYMYYAHMMHFLISRNYTPKAQLYGKLLLLHETQTWPWDIVWVKDDIVKKQ